MARKWVYICSPYRGDVEKNMERARLYSRFAVDCGCIPITPHIYLTQFLDDNLQMDRVTAFEINEQLLAVCEELWVFGTEHSAGMQREIEYAKNHAIKVVQIERWYRRE